MGPFEARRAEVLRQIDGVMVIPSMPVAMRNNDVEHEYRQDSDLYYLTGFAEADSVLVLTTVHAEHRAVLFVRARDPAKEAWEGARAGVDGAVAEFGADAAYPIEELSERLKDYLTGAGRLYYALGRDRAMDDRMLVAIREAAGRGRSRELWPTTIVDPATVIHEMRILKSEDEVRQMSLAANITAEAHNGAMRLAAPGCHEYEVEALLRSVFRKNGSERPAYGPIVGSGPNATVLHYRANNRQMQDGDLLLIDAGCELGYYASDVTRTFPVSGRFTDPQRRIYEIVLAAQQASIELVRPGSTIEAVHDVSVRVLVDGLIEAGLLPGEPEKIIEEQTYRRFFMHRTSHWLGMDVHDVGRYFVDCKPRPFAAGMVLTVEPGLYIAPGDSSVPAEYRGIGVRIEDDVLVTDDGCRDLTGHIPRRVEDVERACRA